MFTQTHIDYRYDLNGGDLKLHRKFYTVKRVIRYVIEITIYLLLSNKYVC